MSTDKIYRYKIKSKELYDSIIEFSKSNRHKEDDEIKKEFIDWVNSRNISILVKEEEEELKKTDYDLINNPIERKIYKSIKYYHIKKINNNSKFKDKPKKNKDTKKNIKFSKELIDTVQKHIKKDENSIKPSLLFDEFIKTNNDLIIQEHRNNNKIDLSDEDYNYKLKKMFKNQYFMIFNK
tara:strand:+ start:294 stop:836 length:543 start_codon:yes stop_codon:yes gene_type:complete